MANKQLSINLDINGESTLFTQTGHSVSKDNKSSISYLEFSSNLSKYVLYPIMFEEWNRDDKYAKTTSISLFEIDKDNWILRLTELIK